MCSLDKYDYDYACRTVGESILKYNIPDDWTAEFDAYDGIYPIAYIPVERIRKSPALMDLKLRMIENEDDELAGCMMFAKQKVIAFKIDYMRDLISALV